MVGPLGNENKAAAIKTAFTSFGSESGIVIKQIPCGKKKITIFFELTSI
jgi:hypothetical protein